MNAGGPGSTSVTKCVGGLEVLDNSAQVLALGVGERDDDVQGVAGEATRRAEAPVDAEFGLAEHEGLAGVGGDGLDLDAKEEADGTVDAAGGMLAACRAVGLSRGRFDRIDERGRAQQELFADEVLVSRRRERSVGGWVQHAARREGTRLPAGLSLTSCLPGLSLTSCLPGAVPPTATTAGVSHPACQTGRSSQPDDGDPNPAQEWDRAACLDPPGFRRQAPRHTPAVGVCATADRGLMANIRRVGLRSR